MAISYTGEYSDVLQDGYVTTALTVSDTQIEAKVGSSPLENRELITVTNRGPGSIYYGPSGVTPSTGEELKKDQTVAIPLGAPLSLFLIKEAGPTSTVIVQEFA
jgi:hypothetical protein